MKSNVTNLEELMTNLRRCSRISSEGNEKLREKGSTLEKTRKELSSRVSVDARLGSQKGNAKRRKEELQYEQLTIAEKLIHSRVKNSMSIHICDDLLESMRAEDGSRSHDWAILDRPSSRVELMKDDAGQVGKPII